MTQYISRGSEATEVQWEFRKSGWIYYSVQAVYTHKDEESSSRGTNTMGAVVCTRRVSRHLEEEHIRRSGGRIIRI